MKDRIYLNNDWDFSPEFDEKMLQPKCRAKFESVRLPHTNVVMPYNSFDESIYQGVSLYRRSFKTEKNWAGKKVLLTIEAAGHQSEVFFNGVSLATHECGYTAYVVDLTDNLLPEGKDNVLCVKVDSRETLNQPPFGYVIDYMTYGGIYREVYLDIKNPVYIQDVFVKTKSNHYESEIKLSTSEGLEGYTIRQRVESADSAAKKSAEVNTGVSGQKVMTSANAQPVVAWTLENPALYNLVTELLDPKGKVADTKTVRFGFREIVFDETGFYLNGKKIKLRGLNRHQCYPYVGYAMPKNMQIDDADILKNQLGLNYVRTSHYPQSQYFIDRCDELGLLVFTEIPGWQHIGDKKWQDVAVENVRDMIVQYRNHPSIFMWGVRINESQDNDDFYTRTNALAHDLDSTRPTGGVRYLRHSNLLEDVYTYNDFSHVGTNEGSVDKIVVTDTHKGYLVTEYNGHMFPTKAFDSEAHRREHAIRHANVLDSVAGHDDCAGASGWCAFDYNTHKDFGSGDRICYHGVMDMFRNPKMAAYVYGCQGDPKVTGDILEVSSAMNIGEYPAGVIGDVWIFTNAEKVKLYVNNIFIKEFSAGDSCYKNLPHGPILIDDYIGNRLVDEEKIPAQYSESLKELLRAIRKFGEDKLPFKYKVLYAKLSMKKVINEKSLREIYAKYVANWGGSSTSYKFEAFRGNKLVKTLVKTTCGTPAVSATVSRSELFEETTYDVTEVFLRAVDENGNVMPFCQEAVTLEAEGSVELIGPGVVSLKGGMAAAYLKTTGKSGKGALVITDWTGKTLKVPVSVKVKKV